MSRRSPRPERPLGRAGVCRIHDERDRLHRPFGRAGLEGRAALLAGSRQRDVLRRTSRLDAFGRYMGRWCTREHRSGELELGEQYPCRAQDQRIDVSPTLAKHFDRQRVEVDREVNQRSGEHMGEEESLTW